MAESKVCPECGHTFQGNGWDGIDAHWKAKHYRVMPYAEAWPLIQSGVYCKSEPFADAVQAQEANMAGVDAQDALDKRAAKAASGRSAEAVAVEQHEAAVGMVSKLSSLAANLDVDLEHREAPDSSCPIARLQKAAKRAKDEGDLPQAEKFAQAARDLGADHDEDAFKGVLRKIARNKNG